MRIVVVHPQPEVAARWSDALAARLPEARVSPWDAGCEHADFAVAWNPPDAFFARTRVGAALFSAGAGVDRLLQRPGLPRDLPVVRVEDAGMGAQMAEYCCHEVLRVFRQAPQYESQQRERIWRELEPRSREAFEVGIFGLGVLGEQVARALGCLGFPVVGYSRSPRGVEGVDCLSGPAALQEFLGRCRALILLAPLTPQTDSLFDAARLAMLPEGAWLINVARGALVVDEDLLQALDRGHLAGATLDVFRTEPLPAEHPFWGHPKIRITPHVSAVTLIEETAAQIAGKIRRMNRGEPITGVIDRSRGY